jgi:hypothetical protein
MKGVSKQKSTYICMGIESSSLKKIGPFNVKEYTQLFQGRCDKLATLHRLFSLADLG